MASKPLYLPTANGVLTAPPGGANRTKKGKRRRLLSRAQQVPPAAAGSDDALPGDEEVDEEVSETDQGVSPESLNRPNPPSSTSKKRNKKKKAGTAQTGDDAGRQQNPPQRTSQAPRSQGHNNIWNTSMAQERQNIKEFWLSLSEERRRALLKIEKEAVLKKMKQQQKDSCSCNSCGRKRHAIEEELEALYENYYKELEHYANDPSAAPPGEGLMPSSLEHPPYPHKAQGSHYKTSAYQEHLNDDEYTEPNGYSEEEYELDEEDEDGEEDCESGDEGDVEPESRAGMSDFFKFGQNLTVKNNVLTVADDVLKDDSRKFIEMMEQLAERRMQREAEAADTAAAHARELNSSYANDNYVHDGAMAGDEYDDDEDYDSQDEEYDEDELDDGEEAAFSEEQRMYEGRRMFQIFAARMFEQRVFTAYREKVALERQQRLLEELKDEEKLENQRQKKKERDAQKKKERKKAQQQHRAEEKARKEAEKAAEEARQREELEKQQEEQRRKKEDQRKKREEAKRKEEEEKARKEAERQRQVQEAEQRRQEASRKKAAEKARKEEQKKREREEREAREAEVRARRLSQERKEREAKAPAPSAPQVTKKVSQSAVPHVKQPPGITPPVPAVPKAATPFRPRQTSGQSPHVPPVPLQQSSAHTGPSATTSPPNVPPPGAPKVISAAQSHSTHETSQAQPQIPSPAGFGPTPSMHLGSVPTPPVPGPRNPPPGIFQQSMAPNRIPANVLPSMATGIARPKQRMGYGLDAPPGLSSPPRQVPIGQTHLVGADMGRTNLQQPPRAESFSQDHAYGPISSLPTPIQRPSSVKPPEDDGSDQSIKKLGSSALAADAEPLGPRPHAASAHGGLRHAHTGFGDLNSLSQPWGPHSAYPGLSMANSWGMPPRWTPVSPVTAPGYQPFGKMTTPPLRGNRSRNIRLAVCDACRYLNARPGLGNNENGWVNMNLVMARLNEIYAMDAMPTVQEIEQVCEILGDASNGGGELQLRQVNGMIFVKWSPLDRGGLGEIGSPLPKRDVSSISGPAGRW
ncbi:hypothetical protein K470DRAFT_267878 [Piedraia hortae CBS 480.64]|uniref:Stress response protein NST1 n=1 Tax=Piedraia hortae CBS 480.64 TaxID=1314780 RepID=A0A6A7CA35_9PEZI|nr:hypothetical protein K470DRAFT_267878 [Piedraia hortae CBS 480.64]